MDSVNASFQPLRDRLYSLTKTTAYIEDFDYETLIKNLESDIVHKHGNAAHKAIDDCIERISDLLSTNIDFFQRFYGSEPTRDNFYKDENGNVGYEENMTPPLPEWRRESVNGLIRLELQFYKNVLEHVKDFATYETGQTHPIPKNENPKAGKRSQKISFGYLHKGKEALLRKVYRECESPSGNFISSETNEDDFIEVLTTQDFRACTKKIHIGCETKEAVYILDKLSKYFKHLKPPAIEKSGLFITNEDNILTANNMYAARNTNKMTPSEDFTLIDDFFESLKQLLRSTKIS